MATNESESMTSPIRTPAQPNNGCLVSSACSGGYMSLPGIIHSMDADPALMPAYPVWDDRFLSSPHDYTPDCQACRNFSERSDLMPETKPPSRPNLPAMASRAKGVNDKPIGATTFLHGLASLLIRTKEISIPSKVCHRWLGFLLGLGSLILAIVCLLMFTVRSYRMAVWTTRNDELQACIGLIQVCNLSHQNVSY